jgi:hypothetical protein
MPIRVLYFTPIFISGSWGRETKLLTYSGSRLRKVEKHWRTGIHFCACCWFERSRDERHQNVISQLSSLFLYNHEQADEVAKQGAALLTPEPPAVGIPRRSGKEATKNWTELQHYIAWNNFSGHRYGKGFVSDPCKKRGEDLFKI